MKFIVAALSALAILGSASAASATPSVDGDGQGSLVHKRDLGR